MKLTAKIYLLLLAAFVTGLLFAYSTEHTRHTITVNTHILEKFNKLAELEQRLDKEVLLSATLIYHNYDSTESLIRQIDSLLAELRTHHIYTEDRYVPVHDLLAEYQQLIRLKTEHIYRFQTLNSLIKNSAGLIPILSSRFFQADMNARHRQYFIELSDVIASVFLSKHSLDPDFLMDINNRLTTLDLLSTHDTELKTFNNVFKAHVSVYLQNFQPFTRFLSLILESGSSDTLAMAGQEFSSISQKEVSLIETLAVILFVIFTLAFISTGWLLLNSDKANRRLKILQQKLEHEAYYDRLTGLKSRLALIHDLRSVTNPVLALIDIDDFKHINDFYGNPAGDMALQFVANTLQEHINQQNHPASVYRMSADEYAILFHDFNEEQAEEITSDIAEDLAHATIKYDHLVIPLSISAGLSAHEPLLEKADLALQQTKHSRKSLLIYTPELSLEKDIEHNLNMASVLRQAINSNNVIPWFQPIMNNDTREISHYECLVRIRTPDGDILTPGAFLKVAKESRLYADITIHMMEQCFAIFASLDQSFSINFSAEDLLDHNVTSRLVELLRQNPDTGKRLMIEFLETEAIDNYDDIQNFISTVRDFGCQIAIDDFGSGYSSLEHILKINPDVVKIDGSLIQNIDRDETTSTFVKAVISTLREIGIKKTIAEFVHSATIQDIVCSMNIAYSQGFHIGEPTAEPLPLPGTAINAG